MAGHNRWYACPITPGMTNSPVATADLSVGPRLVAARWDALWIAGDLMALEPPLVALVGTREADLHGLSIARRFAAALARNGISVLSGGALGIDAAAHAGALDAGGRTAVVLPSGLDQLYPQRHRLLYERIVAAGGALVSPFPPHTPPARWTFPRRNALLAAMCDLLVVVQAPVGSGSLITAEAARRLGRRVLVVPASPGDPRGGGCLKLLRMGAEMCTTPEDILAALANRDGPLQGYFNSREPVRERTVPRSVVRPRRASESVSVHAAEPAAPSGLSQPTWSLDDEGRVVYESLCPTARHVDEIVTLTGLPAARVRAVLLTLVLLGLASDRGDGTYTRNG